MFIEGVKYVACPQFIPPGRAASGPPHMALDCEDCGKRFKNSNRPATICHKCEKRDEVERKAWPSPEDKATALEAVEVSSASSY